VPKIQNSAHLLQCTYKVLWAVAGHLQRKDVKMVLARLELRQEAMQRGKRGRLRAAQGLLRRQHGGPVHVQQLCAGAQCCSAQPTCSRLPPGYQPVRQRQCLLISGASKQAVSPVRASRQLLEG